MLEQLLISGKLGDGCLVRVSETSGTTIKFNTVAMNYLVHKKLQLELNGIGTSNITYGTSGYKKGKLIPRFSSHVDERITKVYEMSKLECINKLNKIGLIYLFLDDGSLHKHKYFGNIYCNTFTDEEIEALRNKIDNFYPQSKTSKLYDRKKDGRVYPYVSIHKASMLEFLKDIQEFVIKYEISDMFYKAGLPSTTISNESTPK